MIRDGVLKRVLPALALLSGLGVTSAAWCEPLEVRRGGLTSRFILAGELVAEDAVQLIVPNANIWPVQVRWLEEDGAEVAAGDTLVEFDNSQLVSNLGELERAVIEALNELAGLRATARTEELEAGLNLERKRVELEKASLDAAVPETLLARQEVEERRLARDRAELGLEEARSALALKRASVEAKMARQEIELAKAETAARRAREGVDLLTLEAPRDGILLVSENSEEGRTFQSGDSTWPGTTIARLPELSSMIVEARLFDVDDGRIRPGMPVTAVVDAFPEKPLPGVILEIENIANETSRFSMRRSFRVRVRVDGLDVEIMRPGMSVKVAVEEHLEDALLIPRAALGWSEIEGAVGVRAHLEDGTIAAVRIGPCDARDCVLEEGLAAGAKLARAVEGGDTR